MASESRARDDIHISCMIRAVMTQLATMQAQIFKKFLFVSVDCVKKNPYSDPKPSAIQSTTVASKTDSLAATREFTSDFIWTRYSVMEMIMVFFKLRI